MGNLWHSGGWKLRAVGALVGLLLVAGGVLGARQRGWISAEPLKPQPPPEAAAGRIPWYTNEAEAMRIAKEKNLPILIDFGAEWCEACHELETRVFTDPRFREKLKSFVPLMIDVTDDSDEKNRIMDRYGIRSLPTLVFIDRDGRVLSQPRIVGYVPAEELISLMNQL